MVSLPGRGRIVYFTLIFEQQGEEQRHDGGHDGRDEPDHPPIMDSIAGGIHCLIMTRDQTVDKVSDHHTHAESNKGDETLGVGADLQGGFAVHVYLAGDEEEIVTDAVKEDSQIEHEDQALIIAEGKEQIAAHPEQHTHQQHVFDAQAGEEKGHNQHKEYLGKLTEGHFGRRTFYSQLT